MAEVIHDADGDHTSIPSTEARQGRWGRPVLWVLLISTLLAAVALFASWGFRSDDLASTETKEAHRTAPAAETVPPPADPGPTATPTP